MTGRGRLVTCACALTLASAGLAVFSQGIIVFGALLAATLADTALLVGVGLSAVIIVNSPDEPVTPLIGPGARLALTGELLGKQRPGDQQRVMSDARRQ